MRKRGRPKLYTDKERQERIKASAKKYYLAHKEQLDEQHRINSRLYYYAKKQDKNN